MSAQEVASSFSGLDPAPLTRPVDHASLRAIVVRSRRVVTPDRGVSIYEEGAFPAGPVGAILKRWP